MLLVHRTQKADLFVTRALATRASGKVSSLYLPDSLSVDQLRPYKLAVQTHIIFLNIFGHVLCKPL